MTIQDSMKLGAAAFADAEQNADSILNSFRGDFAEAVDGVKEEGHIGFLEAEAIKGRADALVTKFRAELYALHNDLKNRCVELDIDRYLPALRDGGPR